MKIKDRYPQKRNLKKLEDMKDSTSAALDFIDSFNRLFSGSVSKYSQTIDTTVTTVSKEREKCLHSECEGCKNGTCWGVHMISCHCVHCSLRM